MIAYEDDEYNKDYKIKDTWTENIDIYRYKITIKETINIKNQAI